MGDTIVICTAVYDDVSLAQSDLEGLEQLHHQGWMGPYDAAVVDQENGRPHIVQRVDQPGFRVVPELLGTGTLPRVELHEAARKLTWQAGLIAIGDSSLARAFDMAIRRANKVTKRSVDQGVDELGREVEEAFSTERVGRGIDAGNPAADRVQPSGRDRDPDAARGVPGIRPSASRT